MKNDENTMQLKTYSDFATLTVAYNDARFIGGMLEGVNMLHNLVLISKPWNGEHIAFDNTDKIAKKLGAEVIYKDCKTPAEQRNMGIDILEKQGYKYILIIDSDEYYLKSDILKIVEYIIENPAEYYRTGNNVKAYWKDLNWYFPQNYVLLGIQSSKRLATNQYGGRSIGDRHARQLPDDICLYHFSYNRSNDEILKKISTRGFSKGLRKDWYQEKWLKWTPDMLDVGPVVASSIPKIFPAEKIPDEILTRLSKNYLL